jgi:hypothetical protein
MTLKATILSIDTDSAIIKLPDGQTLNIALSAIHGTPKIGADIRVLFSMGTADQNETQDLARTLLNELIGTEKSE